MDDGGAVILPFERPGPKDKSAVVILEETLERVRSGELEHVALCYSKPDGTIGHTWSGGARFGILLGAMHYLATCFVTESREMP